MISIDATIRVDTISFYDKDGNRLEDDQLKTMDREAHCIINEHIPAEKLRIDNILDVFNGRIPSIEHRDDIKVNILSTRSGTHVCIYLRYIRSVLGVPSMNEIERCCFIDHHVDVEQPVMYCLKHILTKQ